MTTALARTRTEPQSTLNTAQTRALGPTSPSCDDTGSADPTTTCPSRPSPQAIGEVSCPV